jgi:hypothetical protein
MRFILVTETGNVMAFKIEACAKIYQSIYGGKITELK